MERGREGQTPQTNTWITLSAHANALIFLPYFSLLQPKCNLNHHSNANTRASREGMGAGELYSVQRSNLRAGINSECLYSYAMSKVFVSKWDCH